MTPEASMRPAIMFASPLEVGEQFSVQVEVAELNPVPRLGALMLVEGSASPDPATELDGIWAEMAGAGGRMVSAAFPEDKGQWREAAKPKAAEERKPVEPRTARTPEEEQVLVDTLYGIGHFMNTGERTEAFDKFISETKDVKLGFLATQAAASSAARHEESRSRFEADQDDDEDDYTLAA